MATDSDLEALRRRRMEELMRQQQEGAQQLQFQQQMQEAQIEEQLKMIMHQILSPEAQERLANIRFARAEFARQVEILLVQLYQAGKLPRKLSDEHFKEILQKIAGQKRETSISRR